MPKTAVEVKRTTIIRMIRAVHDAGLKVTGVRVIGREIEVMTAQDGPPTNEAGAVS
jgi:hypothetical protein